MLFTFVGGAGHFEPLVPLASAAVGAGHDVLFACRPSMTGLVERQGHIVVAVGPDVPDRAAIAPLAPIDADREDRVLRDGFARWSAVPRSHEVGALCATWRPDVVVADEVDFGAIVAAEKAGLPYATVVVSPAGTFLRRHLLADPLNDLRRLHGLALDPDLEMLARHLVLAPFPPSFRDPAAPLPATAHPIQPAALAAPDASDVPGWLADLDDRPAIYVTLGTIFNMESGDLFARLLAGLCDLPVSVIATVGRQLDPALFGDQPANIRIERFVVQAAVLPHVDLVVAHGGSGSVIGALVHGVPLVLLPMGADQPDNARQCERLGVASVVDPVTAGPAAIRDAALTVMSDERYAMRTRALRDEALTLPDTAAALSFVAALATERRPLLRG